MKNQPVTEGRFTRILFAVDGTPRSTGAVDAVKTIALAAGAEVHVLHVWNLEARVNRGLWDVETRAEATELVEGIAGRLAAAGVRATSEVTGAAEKKIPDAIADAARQYSAGLIAVGSRGRSSARLTPLTANVALPPLGMRCEPRGLQAHAVADQAADLSERRIPDPVVDRGPLPAPCNHPGRRQARKVLRNVLAGDPGPSGQLSDRKLTRIMKNAEDSEPGRIAEEREAVGGLLEQVVGNHGACRIRYNAYIRKYLRLLPPPTEVHMKAGDHEFTVEIEAPITAVEGTLRELLKAEGFGVLTEIDVQSTFAAKLGVSFRSYRILGACNPALALRALSVDASIGLLLPCNIVLEEVVTGRTLARFMEPIVGLAMVADAALEPIAREASQRLHRVAGGLADGVPAERTAPQLGLERPATKV